MGNGQPRSSRVSVPLPLVVGLAVAVFACLLVIAWLLGRESGRRLADVTPPPAASASASAPAQATAPPLPAGVAPSSTPFPIATPLPRPDSPAPAGDLQPPPAPPAASSSTADPREAAEVARYFRELESLSGARYWDDPEAFAKSLVQELAGGSTSGIDRLRRTQAEVAATVRRMAVPEPCREHHRRSLELFEAAGRLLDAISAGAASGDMTRLLAASAEAQSLQTRAEELRRLEDQLRRSYGLAPLPAS